MQKIQRLGLLMVLLFVLASPAFGGTLLSDGILPDDPQSDGPSLSDSKRSDGDVSSDWFEFACDLLSVLP